MAEGECARLGPQIALEQSLPAHMQPQCRTRAFSKGPIPYFPSSSLLLAQGERVPAVPQADAVAEGLQSGPALRLHHLHAVRQRAAVRSEGATVHMLAPSQAWVGAIIGWYRCPWVGNRLIPRRVS